MTPQRRFQRRRSSDSLTNSVGMWQDCSGSRVGSIIVEDITSQSLLSCTLAPPHQETALGHLLSVFTPLSHQGMKKGPRSEAKKTGPLKMAQLSCLSVSRQPMYGDIKDEPERASNVERVGHQQPSSNSAQQLLQLI